MISFVVSFSACEMVRQSEARTLTAARSSLTATVLDSAHQLSILLGSNACPSKTARERLFCACNPSFNLHTPSSSISPHCRVAHLRHVLPGQSSFHKPAAFEPLEGKTAERVRRTQSAVPAFQHLSTTQQFSRSDLQITVTRSLIDHLRVEDHILHTRSRRIHERDLF